MSSTVAYLQDEHKRKRERIKQAIEEYIHGNPEMTTFRFFLPSDQDLDEIKQAAATISQRMGKPIDLIYPVCIVGRMTMHDSITPEVPIKKSRNDVLQEIREHLGPKTPQTIRLIDALIAAWDTIDIFTEIFSAEQAQSYMQAGFEQEEEAYVDNE
jgi:hypothetical protein